MDSRIYLIEDHIRFQRILIDFINRLPGLSICGSATVSQEALMQIPLLSPDLVITDIRLGVGSGLDLVRDLRRLLPKLPVMIYSSCREAFYVKAALSLEVSGYVIKGNPLELERGIRHILRGKIYLCPQASEAVINRDN